MLGLSYRLAITPFIFFFKKIKLFFRIDYLENVIYK